MNKLKYFLIVSLVVCASCKSHKLITTDNSDVSSLKRAVTLNENEKRKFDYFFYEAERLKISGDIDKSKLYLIECLKVDSLSSVCYYELANIQIRYKDFKGAETLLKKAVEINPVNKWYKLLLGDIYQQNKKISDAIEVYKDLVSNYPEKDEYIYVLAQFYVQNKQFQEAIDTYNLLEKSIGLNEYISIEKEKLYLQLGKKSNAFKEVNTLIDDNPNESRYYGFLGDLYLYFNDLVNAEESYNKILAIDKGNGLGYFSLANISLLKKDTIKFFSLFQQGIKDKNLSIDDKINRLLPFLSKDEFKYFNHGKNIEDIFLSLIELHGDDPKSFIYYANYLRSIKEDEAAYEYFKKGLSINNLDVDLWNDLFMLEINLEKYDELEADTEEALTLFPEQPVFYMFNGIAYLQKKSFDKALNSLEKGLTYVSDNNYLLLQYYSYLGETYYNLKETDTAFNYYDKALKIDEHNVLILNNYSYYLSLENRDLDKAEKMISKCIELEPGNSTYLDTYAWVLFKRGRYFEAKYIIERAIDNGGDLSDVIVEHYGDILFMNNDKTNAIKQWNKSKEMGNTSEVLNKKLELEKYVEE